MRDSVNSCGQPERNGRIAHMIEVTGNILWYLTALTLEQDWRLISYVYLCDFGYVIYSLCASVSSSLKMRIIIDLCYSAVGRIH